CRTWRTRASRSSSPSRGRPPGTRSPRSRAGSSSWSAPPRADVPAPLLAVAVLLLQAPAGGGARARPDLRAGLDTLYAGEFATAAARFAALGARDTSDPAPVIFEAGAFIWWAAAKDSDDFEAPRIDSLLALAIARARAGGPALDFWLGTALGYRAGRAVLRHEARAYVQRLAERFPANPVFQRFLTKDVPES